MSKISGYITTIGILAWTSVIYYYVLRIYYAVKTDHQKNLANKGLLNRERSLNKAYSKPNEVGDQSGEDCYGLLLVFLCIIFPLTAVLVWPWIEGDFYSVNACVGVTILWLGNFLLHWSHSCLGKNWWFNGQVSAEHQVVDFGCYRLVRHPMYTAFILTSVGNAVLWADTNSWMIAISSFFAILTIWVFY